MNDRLLKCCHPSDASKVLTRTHNFQIESKVESDCIAHLWHIETDLHCQKCMAIGPVRNFEIDRYSREFWAHNKNSNYTWSAARASRNTRSPVTRETSPLAQIYRNRRTRSSSNEKINSYLISPVKKKVKRAKESTIDQFGHILRDVAANAYSYKTPPKKRSANRYAEQQDEEADDFVNTSYKKTSDNMLEHPKSQPKAYSYISPIKRKSANSYSNSPYEDKRTDSYLYLHRDKMSSSTKASEFGNTGQGFFDKFNNLDNEPCSLLVSPNKLNRSEENLSVTLKFKVQSDVENRLDRSYDKEALKNGRPYLFEQDKFRADLFNQSLSQKVLDNQGDLYSDIPVLQDGRPYIFEQDKFRADLFNHSPSKNERRSRKDRKLSKENRTNSILDADVDNIELAKTENKDESKMTIEAYEAKAMELMKEQTSNQRKERRTRADRLKLGNVKERRSSIEDKSAIDYNQGNNANSKISSNRTSSQNIKPAETFGELRSSVSRLHKAEENSSDAVLDSNKRRDSRSRSNSNNNINKSPERLSLVKNESNKNDTHIDTLALSKELEAQREIPHDEYLRKVKAKEKLEDIDVSPIMRANESAHVNLKKRESLESPIKNKNDYLKAAIDRVSANKHDNSGIFENQDRSFQQVDQESAKEGCDEEPKAIKSFDYCFESLQKSESKIQDVNNNKSFNILAEVSSPTKTKSVDNVPDDAPVNKSIKVNNVKILRNEEQEEEIKKSLIVEKEVISQSEKVMTPKKSIGEQMEKIPTPQKSSVKENTTKNNNIKNNIFKTEVTWNNLKRIREIETMAALKIQKLYIQKIKKSNVTASPKKVETNDKESFLDFVKIMEEQEGLYKKLTSALKTKGDDALNLSVAFISAYSVLKGKEINPEFLQSVNKN